MSKRILLLEDDVYLREGLCEILKKEDYIVESADCCSSCRKLLSQNSYDLLILDEMLPDGNGIDICKEIRLYNSGVPILFLTACDEEFQIVRGLDSGADDYVTKPFKMLELLSRVRALLRRRKSVYQSSGIIMDIDKMSVIKDGEALLITPTEFQILNCLITNTPNVVKRNTLLERIWDCDSDYIDDNTLSVHISRLREKVGSEHIVTVRGAGYKWMD